MGENNKILVVDDDDSIRETYVHLLKENGFEVLEAKDGVEGLDIATSQSGISLIFTGIIMPRMDGFQLIQSLKEYSNTSNIPVIVNSHLGREEDRKKMEELGARDFIVQGITTPADTLKRILQVLNKGEYNLSINPLELDGQRFAEDHRMPVDYKCENCGAILAVKLKYFRKNQFISHVYCPSCEKQY